MLPLVSVVVVVRNERAALAECLDGLMAQTYPRERLDFVVVDGHSSDGTGELAATYPARVVRDGGRGCAEARNVGIAHAQGEIVAFTDADCIPSPGWLVALARPFRARGVDGVGGALRHRRSSSRISVLEDLNTLLTYRGFITSNVAYRRAMLERVGGFDPDLVCGEDWDLYWRVRDAGGAVAYEPSAVVVHAPHETSEWELFLAKQFWYGRNDVRLFAKRAARAREAARTGERFEAAHALRLAGSAAADAVGVGALAGLAFAPALAGGAGCAALGALADEALEMSRTFPAEAPFGVAFGYLAAKSVARGLGSLAGVGALFRDSAVASLARAAARVIPDGEAREASAWRRSRGAPLAAPWPRRVRA